jgi:hypothetical protein
MVYHGQALQDKFVLNVLKKKRGGTFLELGANHPIDINNTYTLEKEFGWKGIMIEYDEKYLKDYKEHREGSVHLIADATKVDYKKLLEENDMPKTIDYLQIDLDAGNGSTMEALEMMDRDILDDYKFATITFEHDYYCAGDYKSTREKSRAIFEKRGYVRVFDDIHDREPEVVYEDWYVHPDLVDMDYVNKLSLNNSMKYIDNNLTGKSIDWRSICYEDDLKITYSIQVCNESRELFSLLNFLVKTIDYVDNIHVIVDTPHKTEKVQKVLDYFDKKITVFERTFDTFYKNSSYHKEVATGDYVFAIDADEMPQEMLIKTIKQIIATTKGEVIFVPRINIHPGMTQEFLHKCKQFKVNEAGWINWPDFQGRLYKRADHIKWTDEIHTKLYGSDNAIGIQPIPQLALWHIKSMEKQQSRWVENKGSDKGYCDGGFDITPPSEDNIYDELM